MSNVKIWHNPRCSKSRNAVELLDEKGVDAEIVKYLDTPPSKEELEHITNLVKTLDIRGYKSTKSMNSLATRILNYIYC